ncbi:MAG: hypothetical protein ACRYFX_04590 [Janthinobacterium lividum]
MIQLKDALHHLEHPARDRQGHPVPAHIEFVTCDETKDTGGELVSLDAVVLAKLARPSAAGRQAPRTSTKPANQFDNGTRNFLLVTSQEIRKVCVRLITQFNHETVVY